MTWKSPALLDRYCVLLTLEESQLTRVSLNIQRVLQLNYENDFLMALVIDNKVNSSMSCAMGDLSL